MRQVKQHSLIVLVLFSMMFLNIATVSQAQTSSTTQNPIEESHRMSKKSQQVVNVTKSKKRFQAYSQKLTKLSTQLQDRIIAAQINGVDTALSEQHLQDAIELLSRTDRDARAVLTSTTRSDSSLGQTIQQTRSQYLQVFALLSQSVDELKNAS